MILQSYISFKIESLANKAKLLDGTAKLCEREWFLFQEDGNNIRLNFLETGELVLIRQGDVIRGSWEFLKNASRLILSIKGEQKAYQIRLDVNGVMIWQLVDSNSFLCLLKDKKPLETIRSLEELNKYLVKLEKYRENERIANEARKFESGTSVYVRDSKERLTGENIDSSIEALSKLFILIAIVIIVIAVIVELI